MYGYCSVDLSKQQRDLLFLLLWVDRGCVQMMLEKCITLFNLINQTKSIKLYIGCEYKVIIIAIHMPININHNVIFFNELLRI